MSCTTRDEVLKLAESKLGDLVELTSKLIQIPSENPIGTQRDVVDFVKNYLTSAGISCEEVAAIQIILVWWRKSEKTMDSVLS